VDFIIDAKSTSTFHAEIASAVQQTTGTQDTKTVTVGTMLPKNTKKFTN
jgi:hypothetical protein